LGNVGVGDVAEILQKGNVGVVMRAFADADVQEAVEHALRLCDDRQLPARCVDMAAELFSLRRGVAEYRRIYESLVS
jgi:glycogen synthase